MSGDIIDHIICQHHSYLFLDEYEKTRPVAQACRVLSQALPLANPSRAFCDVLSGEQFELGLGVKDPMRGPPMRHRFYWQ